MNSDSARIKRLAKRAKQLDDMIRKAATMQKRIVDEIERISADSPVRNKRPSASTKSRARR
jgi:hypothetical protein